MTAAAFLGALGGFYVVLRVVHGLADYWFQTAGQVSCKGGAGWAGRRACASHCLVHVLATAVALGLVAGVTPGPTLYEAPRLVAALLVIGATHYFADRRAPLRRLAVLVSRDVPWIDNGGLAFLDQEWHRLWLLVAAAILAGGVPAG